MSEFIKNILERTFQSEFNLDTFKNFINHLFSGFDFSHKSNLNYQLGSEESRHVKNFLYLGNFTDVEDESIDALVVELHSGRTVERARSLQRNLIGRYLKNNLDKASNALVAFYSYDSLDWRLSFIKIETRLTEKGVRVEIGTPPKRYSFLVGKNEPSHTAKKQLFPLLAEEKREKILISEVERTFSVEKVTKEFYIEIAKKFTELVGGERKIGSKKFVEKGTLKLPSTNDDTVKKEFAVRLIGRLLFCWFLKKKVSDKDGIPLIPQEILSSMAVEKYSNYYHAILEPLFFEVLNTPIDKRKKEFKGDVWANIPFLNGGLFEPHHHDFYEPGALSISMHINTLKVPDNWLKDLFKVFESYNFTIDENTSIDIDLSVDPEMLGRIFENLLAEINPETGETARKATGSYYTPRPIVEYMVDESLKQFLITQTSVPEDKLSKLLSYGDTDVDLTEPEKDLIIDALDRLKIIDPACGSGAFPMGILQKMLLILQKVDPKSTKWLSKKLEKIESKILRDDAEKKLKNENWDYVHKLGIIQSSIYGVDIQPIATEISKLRFFLSLIVDEKTDDTKPNRGVEPLPNLEFKFVSANSLIGLPKRDGSISESPKDIEKLKRLREAYFTSFGEEKKRIEEEFIETQKKMFEHSLKWKAQNTQTLELSQWNPFADEPSPWFDPEWMFGVRDGFDFVIGNPPYVRQEQIKEYKPLLKNIYKCYTGAADIYVYFYERGLNLLREHGVLTFITSNKYMRAGYGEKLREFINTSATIKQLIDFGDAPVFEATSYPSIILLQKDKSQNGYIKALSWQREMPVAEFERVIYANNFLIPQKELTTDGWNIESPLVLRLLEKLRKAGKPLGEHVSGRFYRGILTGLNEAFVVDRATRDRLIAEHSSSAEVLKPFLRGRDVKRWRVNFAERYLIKIESSENKKHSWSEKNQGEAERIFAKTYPAIHAHLENYRKELIQRDDQGKHFWELRSCKYWQEFEQPKIILGRFMNKATFAFDRDSYFHNDALYMIAGVNEFVVAILNSSVSWWFLTQICTDLQNGYLQAFRENLFQIPIINAGDTTQVQNLVNNIMKAKQTNPNADVSDLERKIDQMAYKLYGLTPEEISIVEGRN